MAATLFIIQFPKENIEKAPDDDGLKDAENDDIVEDISSSNKEESKRRSPSQSPVVSLAPDSDPDLEVDAQKVEENEDGSIKVSSPKTAETNNEHDTINNTDDEIEDIPSSEENEIRDALINKKKKFSVSVTIPKIPSTQNVNENNVENGERSPPKSDNNTSEKNVSFPYEALDDTASHTMLDFLTKEPLETQLKNLLESMSITNVNWSTVEGYKQALFIDCGDPNRVEDILDKLMTIGIGQKVVGSSVSLFPATVHIEKAADDNKDEEDLMDSEKEKESKFLKSVKSRMIVAQVVETVRSNAVFTFDYCMLIILASMIACIGLIENSSVILVASMLISPLMGPILAGTFGITIQNSPLRNLGIRSECIGLTMCIVCGFLCGLVVGGIQIQGLTGYVDEWPTLEMKSRGMSRSLWVGVFIALPSGAGVALSVLGGNTGSLVGVAISASLLPPAVNAGMLWAFALLTVIAPLENSLLTNTTTTSRSELGCLPFQDNDYEPVYSCDMAVEMGIMGSISLLLTLINIFCIFLVGVIMLKIKEVVPQTSPAGTVEFWGSDLKVARDSYKTMKGPESAFLQQKFRNEWDKLKANEADLNRSKFERILERISTVLPDNPYSTLPYHTPTDENPEDQQTHHTIHNIPYSKWFEYRTVVPSPGVRVVRPFSFPNQQEETRTPTPTKTPKSKNSKRARFSFTRPKKAKFDVTPVPESSLMKSSTSEEAL